MAASAVRGLLPDRRGAGTAGPEPGEPGGGASRAASREHGPAPGQPESEAGLGRPSILDAYEHLRDQSLFGSQLDAVTEAHIRGLVKASVQEAFDLDFKGELYGRGDSDRQALTGDVAALANTAGGEIVLGIEEDEHARASDAPGVDLSDAEVARIRQIVASLVAPLPVMGVISVSYAQTSTATQKDSGRARVVAAPL